MSRKPVRHAENLEVKYGKQHWQQLTQFRSEAISLMNILGKANITSITYGSIARGDVSTASDIDVFIPSPPSSFTVETVLERAGVTVNRRFIIQATPYYALKGYLEIHKQKIVSFPLVRMRSKERDFYRFGGEITLPKLKEGNRIVGVDKRLMLIEPSAEGHFESNIVGREEEIAKLLAISVETVFDRVRALLRRDKIGRTGVFIETELASDQTFELTLKRLSETKPEVRRRLRTSEK